MRRGQRDLGLVRELTFDKDNDVNIAKPSKVVGGAAKLPSAANVPADTVDCLR